MFGARMNAVYGMLTPVSDNTAGSRALISGAFDLKAHRRPDPSALDAEYMYKNVVEPACTGS